MPQVINYLPAATLQLYRRCEFPGSSALYPAPDAAYDFVRPGSFWGRARNAAYAAYGWIVQVAVVDPIIVKVLIARAGMLCHQDCI